MGYRFEAGHSVEKNVRRIAEEEIQDAVAGLRKRRTLKDRDKSIHEARKSVKKMRGLLRLLRPAMGSEYQNANRRLRDIGRGLSELRDAGAIIETFNSVAAEHKRDWPRGAAAAIRRGLAQQKRRKERELNAGHVMETAAQELEKFGKTAHKWRIQEGGFTALDSGLRCTYRDGRKAMRRAHGSDDPELYHDWRKRAKDHWYHVRLLSPLWAGTKESREDCLHELETSLGDDHNLEVLCALLSGIPEQFGGEEAVSLFADAARKKQEQLRARALELGERLYEQKPKELLQDFERMWRVWENEPEEVRAAAG